MEKQNEQSAGLTICIKNGIHIIKFDNPLKRNAITNEAYEILAKSLNDAAINPKVCLTVLTGAGSYYSSGFNIGGTQDIFEDMENAIRTNLEKLSAFISALIDYPKLLIAVVNGPALGVAVTTLALCDVVYASNTATFRTPFTSLALCVEGCSSYTFPKILGKSKANEMLLLNHEMTAEEAHRFGLVSEIFDESKSQQIWQKIEKYAQLSPANVMISKNLIKKFDLDKLHEANTCEMKQLFDCMMSEEFMNNIIKFMNRKQKSKY